MKPIKISAMRAGALSALAALCCLQAHCDGEPLGKVIATDLGLAYFARRRAEMGLR